MVDLAQVTENNVMAFKRLVGVHDILWAVGANLLWGYHASNSAMSAGPLGLTIAAGHDLHWFREEGLGASHLLLPAGAVESAELVKHRESVGSRLLELDVVVVSRNDGAPPLGLVASSAETGSLVAKLKKMSGTP